MTNEMGKRTYAVVPHTTNKNNFFIGRHWLYNIARGIDLEAVTARLTSKSIGCCKKFPGRNAIVGVATLTHWLHELAKEICERLEQDELENNRRPKQLVVSYLQTINNNDVSSSRSLSLTAFDEEKMVNDALDVLKRNTEKFYKSADNSETLNNPIKFLGLSVGKFETQDTKRSNTIQEMFKKTIDTQAKSDENKDNDAAPNEESMPEGYGHNKRDIVVEKKSTTIQGMFKKTTETSMNNDEKREKPPIDDTGKMAMNQESASHSNTGQSSFFAKLNVSKSIAGTEKVRNQPSTSVSAEAESKEQCDETNDLNSFQNEVLLEEIAENELNQMRAASPVSSTSKQADYTQTYAEYYRPPPNLEISKVKCSQCNKMVNAHEIQVHNDAHFAFLLSQEQRTEFQSKLQKSMAATATPPAAKKVKTSKSSATMSTSSTFSIDKFLVKKDDLPRNESVASCSSAIDVEKEACIECGKSIPIADILEHMDYHAAKKLHDELLMSESTLSRSVGGDTKSKANVTTGDKGNKIKKRAKHNDNKSNDNNNSMKSIATFFRNT